MYPARRPSRLVDAAPPPPYIVKVFGAQGLKPHDEGDASEEDRHRPASEMELL